MTRQESKLWRAVFTVCISKGDNRNDAANAADNAVEHYRVSEKTLK